MGLVSMLGPGLLRAGPTVGDSPSASTSATAIASDASAEVTPGSTDPSVTGARFTQGIAATDTSVLAAVDGSQSQPTQQAALQPATGTNLKPPADSVAPRVSLRPTTIVWARVAGVSSYDFELVRNGSRIYAASSSSPNVEVPRSWTHRGLRFFIQPEDQAFVWPVIGGRRAAEPVVNGTLAFDHTRIARFTG
jgi:hypothetical protein